MRRALRRGSLPRGPKSFAGNGLNVRALWHQTCSDLRRHNMTVDRFLKPGEGEMLKGAVHAAVGGLALVCGIYNAAAWITRRERHLGVNAVMYSALAIWEAVHVRHDTQRGSRE